MRSVKGLSRISETDLRRSYSTAVGLIFSCFTGCMIINGAMNLIDFSGSVKMDGTSRNKSVNIIHGYMIIPAKLTEHNNG